MKYISSCSGGKDSTASLIVGAEHGEPLDEVVCCEIMFDKDISGEVPEHIEFIYTKLKPFVEKKLGVPFVIVRSEKTYMDVFHHVMCRGKGEGKICGFAIPGLCAVKRDCKLPPIQKYWKSKGEDVTQYVGIAADEPKRLASLKGTNMISLLEKYKITEGHAEEICKAHGLYSPIYGFARRNGCWFCPNCADSEWIHLIRNHPELFERLVELERTENLYRRCLTINETASEIKERLSIYTEQLSWFE